jgi:hypothetical protein
LNLRRSQPRVRPLRWSLHRYLSAVRSGVFTKIWQAFASAWGPFGESVVSVNPAHRVAELGRSLGAEGIARKTLRTRLHIAEGWIGFGGHVGFPPKTPRVQRRAQRTSVRYGVDTPRPAQWSSTKARKASLLSRARATLRRPMSTFFALSKS